jgi:hypothetical protein
MKEARGNLFRNAANRLAPCKNDVSSVHQAEV